MSKSPKKLNHNGLSTKHPSEYQSWIDMINRCNSDPIYIKNGIKVCSNWTASFRDFLEDMGLKPHHKMRYSIDRINNDLGYFPKNCQWATPKQQARNRNTNKILTYKRTSLCITEWSEKIGLSKQVIASRLKAGWSVKKTLSTPKMDKSDISHLYTAKIFTHNGITKTIAKWCREKGISYQTVYNRIASGWSVKKAILTPLVRENKMLTFNGKIKSITQWAKHLGVSRKLIRDRLKKGWTVFDTLNTPSRKHRSNSIKQPKA